MNDVFIQAFNGPTPQGNGQATWSTRRCFGPPDTRSPARPHSKSRAFVEVEAIASRLEAITSSKKLLGWRKHRTPGQFTHRTPLTELDKRSSQGGLESSGAENWTSASAELTEPHYD